MIFTKLSNEELNRKSAQEALSTKKMPVILVLENIRSMHNVGSIFRTADAFQIEKIALCGFTPKPPHRDIEKTALGATQSVSWIYEREIIDLLHRLKNQGYIIAAIEQTKNSIKLDNFIWQKEHIVLVIGNELRGVSNEVLSLCDHVIEIPQIGMKHSLNVSVVAGVVMWDFFKRYIKV